jgi:hypothetical protein
MQSYETTHINSIDFSGGFDSDRQLAFVNREDI